MNSALSEQYAELLLAEIRGGIDITTALLSVTKAHADHLRELGPIRVLALDPCPVCMGQVIASAEVARCGTCGWTHHQEEGQSNA